MKLEAANRVELSDKERKERRYALIGPIGMVAWITLGMGGLVGYVAYVEHPKAVEARQEIIDAGKDDGIEIINVNSSGRGVDTIDISMGNCALTGIQYSTETVDGDLDITDYDLQVAGNMVVSFSNLEELQELSVMNLCNKIAD